MSRFKVGDHIRYNDKGPVIGGRKRGFETVVVPECRPSALVNYNSNRSVVCYVGPDGEHTWCPEDYWDFVFNPKEEAIKLLEEEGYTVTPPKPKKKAWIIRYSYENSKKEYFHPSMSPSLSKAEKLLNRISRHGIFNREIIEIEITDWS